MAVSVILSVAPDVELPDHTTVPLMEIFRTLLEPPPVQVTTMVETVIELDPVLEMVTPSKSTSPVPPIWAAVVE